MIEPRPAQSRTPSDDTRSENDLELDVAVALRIEQYRWVAWDDSTLKGSPVQEPGRFIGHPGDLLAHLYTDARPDLALAVQPYRRLPHYSSDASPAVRAAERAGVFRHEGVVIACTPCGVWHLAARDAGLDLEDDCFPRLLVRAALRLVGEGP